jgi:hypothetical protein
LEFDALLSGDALSQSEPSFTATFNDAVYNVCGGCDIVGDDYDYDVSFWGDFNRAYKWSGCTNLGADNYENAIFDDGSCEYSVQDPEQIGN